MAAQVCFDRSTFYTVLIISCAIFVYGLLSPIIKAEPEDTVKVKYIVSEPSPPVHHRSVHHEDDGRNFETARFLNPLIPPLRRGPLNLGPGGMNRRQYGYDSGVFNQMGFLHNPENEEQAMPLMGRRLHSQQFEYYTFHHHNPEIKIPIKITGDKEINDGETVTVHTYAKPFQAKIYELDTPRYVPF